MSALGDARHEARRLRRRVQKKMYRLEVNKNVDWDEPVNKKYNVLPSLESLNRMTLKQVQSSIAKMEKFTSRTTQYYGDVEGRILNPKAVFKYKNEENKWLKKSAKEFAKYKDIPAYNAKDKQTVGDIWLQRTPSFGFQDLGTANPLRVKKRVLANLTNGRALKKLTQDLQKKNNPNYFKRLGKAHRKETGQMLKRIGSGEAKRIQDMIDGLNDEAFNLLWNDSRFANALSMAYEIVMAEIEKDTGGNEGRRSHVSTTDQDQIDQAMNDARYVIGWAGYYMGTGDIDENVAGAIEDYMYSRRTPKSHGRIKRKRKYNTRKNPNSSGRS